MSTFHILVPTDFSECSQAALRHAMSLAQVHSPARVTLLHVNAGVVPLYDAQLGILEPNRLLTRMKMEIAERAIELDIPIDEQILYGDPIAKIVEVANQQAVDLIVMGTHGRTGFDRLIMGSVAEAVLRKTPCPVLFVKDGAAERSPTALEERDDYSRSLPADKQAGSSVSD